MRSKYRQNILIYTDGACTRPYRKDMVISASVAVFGIGGRSYSEDIHTQLSTISPLMFINRAPIPMAYCVKPTNNVAELYSIHVAICWLVMNDVFLNQRKVDICTDSRIAKNLVENPHRSSNADLTKSCYNIKRILDSQSKMIGHSVWDLLTIRWVPRQILVSSVIAH